MKIFFKKNHSHTGMHRYVQGFTIHSDYELIIIEDIKESNLHAGESAIFAGFLPYDLRVNNTFKNKYYVYCSPFGQAELSGPDFYSPEISLLLDLNQAIKEGIIKNAIVASESISFSLNFVYMPPVKLGMDDNIYYIKTREGYGFMGNNGRKHRNVANQIAAISRLSPKEPIMVKVPEAYQPYESLFDCKFETDDMSSDENYYKAIAKHILGFQCSWSESFNYIALEYAFMGVPCIVSPAISWYPVEELIIWNVDSTQEIFETAQSLLKNKAGYIDTSEFLKDWAIDFNKEQKEKLYNILSEFGRTE